MRGSGPGMVWMASCQERDPPTCSEVIEDMRTLWGHYAGDKMVSIVISFVKLIGHFLLYVKFAVCPVYHRKLIGLKQFGYVSISFNRSDISAVITLGWLGPQCQESVTFSLWSSSLMSCRPGPLSCPESLFRIDLRSWNTPAGSSLSSLGLRRRGGGETLPEHVSNWSFLWQ